MDLCRALHPSQYLVLTRFLSQNTGLPLLPARKSRMSFVIPHDKTVCKTDDFSLTAAHRTLSVASKKYVWAGFKSLSVGVKFDISTAAFGSQYEIQQSIEKFASLWRTKSLVKDESSKIPSLAFNACSWENCNIRVCVVVGRTCGSYSVIGSEAKSDQHNRLPTMVLDYSESGPYGNLEWKRLVCHEFGHAYGLLHEHQSSSVPHNLQWNYATIASYCNWSVDKVKSNFDSVYDSNTYSLFDPHSVMLYSIPASWYSCASSKFSFEQRMNSEPSSRDIEGLIEAYDKWK
ncbi:mitochondrial ZnMc_MMP_like_3 domain-containing protein zinc-dependent metalloprotease [Andalucia godoyi]|uniref:Mitochondrial ZnMc_MMP_like_3 domain-containing protein zinc-dependent metalloprotease n=1 Tax=Andalucia godoyi TaxID=505711 RepID=A0A8K0AII3_ANDGO|nr:mitochondrial ZnMc_MMP_like_3 domain-containing protein zinc-dependent metalloprotease [Andalucia godoyi]|eukprot:ANDGO_01897.mRNA.1 mitochondrial ZnMc_MMP_like_3 domain-containing protein zinc-dependent metalloprotease